MSTRSVALTISEAITGEEWVSFLMASSMDFQPPLTHLVDVSAYGQKLRERGRVLVARVGSDPVGAAAFYCNDMESRVAYLSYLYVVVGRRSKGLGQVLLRRACEISREAGMAKMRVQTSVGNQAMHLYEREGFHIEGQRIVQGIGKVVMGKNLTC